MALIGADAVVMSDTASVVDGANAIVAMSAAALPTGPFIQVGWGGFAPIYDVDFTLLAETEYPQDDYVWSSAAATASVYGVMGTRDDTGFRDLWVIDADGATISTVSVDFAWSQAFALAMDAATAYVADIDAGAGRIRTMDTATGTFDAVIESRAGFSLAAGGLRVLSDGRILALWQTLEAPIGDPVESILARYASDGTLQDDVTVDTFTQESDLAEWWRCLMVAPDESTVWVLLTTPDLGETTGAQEWSIASLTLVQETTTQLSCIDGFIAPVAYTQTAV